MSYIIKDPDTFRNNVRTQFNLTIEGIIAEMKKADEGIKAKAKAGENPDAKYDNLDIRKWSANLEISIFNYSIREAINKKIVKTWQNVAFCHLYIDRLRTVYCNLKPEIINQVLNDEIKIQDVGFMTHQEFDETKWKELIDKKIKRDDSKFNAKIEASTSLFTCKKCGSNKCTYYELQIRSADEPATIFITCLNCGKHWKI